MATTTTNYGWDIPQSTDLVKDGATAIATLGQDIDTTFVDLKGGTTGQILSKASNTDNDYSWITPNPGDITGVTAGTGLSGGGTSGDVTVSIDSTYYLFANQVRRNALLNSNFSVWQRGTSFSLAASTTTTTYTADRWATRTGANQACTISRQATGDTTNLPNIQYCLRYQRNSGQTGTGALTFLQNMESVNSIPFSGKTVIVSFYARAGANYSAASGVLAATLWSGTGTDQDAFAGYTGAGSVGTTNATLTTTWQRFTLTGSVPATATELNMQFVFTPVGTASTNDYFEITGVQLELGSVANTYMPNQPTYQSELAACQRYYWRAGGDAIYQALGTGLAASTTSAKILIALPSTLRTTPSAVDYSTLQVGDFTTDQAVTTLALNASCTTKNAGYVEATVASGLTQWRPAFLSTRNSTAAYVGFSAEL